MHRRCIALAPLTSLVAGVVLWLVPAEAATPESTYQQRAIAATNTQRAHHDRVALEKQDCLQRFAVRQAERMARQGRMFHQELGPILRECGLSLVGENVAYGYPSGSAVVNGGWMHSPPHRENILRPQFRLIGLGARQSADGTWYASQVFGRKAGR